MGSGRNRIVETYGMIHIVKVVLRKNDIFCFRYEEDCAEME